MSRRWLSAAMVAACMALNLLCTIGAHAQAAPAATAAQNCPDSAQDLPVQALFGSWDATFEGVPGIATVQLARHPDYEGVRGTVTRAGQAPAQLAGDIDNDGLIALDESQDGKSISATWSGSLEPASCGKEFKGTWRNASDDSTKAFTLRKNGRWQ